MIVNQKREPMLANWGVNLAHYKRNLRPLPPFKRNITQVISGLQQYINIPTATAVGDFKYSFYAYMPSADNYIAFMSGQESESRVARVQANGTMRAYVGGSVVNSSSLIRDGYYKKISVERAGSTVVLSFDDSPVGSSTSDNNLGAFSISSFLGAPAGTTLSGSMWDIHLEKGFTQKGNDRAGFDGVFYPVKENYLLADGTTKSSVVRNSLAVERNIFNSSKVFTPFLNNTAVSDGNTVSVTAVDNVSGAYVFLSEATGTTENLVDGGYYLVRFKARSDSDNAVVGLHTVVSITTDRLTAEYKEYELILPATVQNHYIRAAVGTIGKTLDIKDIEVLAGGGHGSATNISSENAQQFIMKENGDLSGKEIATLSSVAFDGTEANYSIKPLSDIALALGSTYVISSETDYINDLQSNVGGWYWNTFVDEPTKWVSTHNSIPYVQTNTNSSRGIGTVHLSIKQLLEKL